MWEFSIGLILLDLHPESLALVALFGLIDSLAQVLAGPFVGAYIDRHAIPSHVSCFLLFLNADVDLPRLQSTAEHQNSDLPPSPSTMPPYLQDAKTGCGSEHVPAAERSCGTVCLQRFFGIISHTGKPHILDLHSGHHIHWLCQQRRLPR